MSPPQLRRTLNRARALGRAPPRDCSASRCALRDQQRAYDLGLEVLARGRRARRAVEVAVVPLGVAVCEAAVRPARPVAADVAARARAQANGRRGRRRQSGGDRRATRSAVPKKGV
eukprot:6191609-Pleurochrysis_carterae.AAC.1